MRRLVSLRTSSAERAADLINVQGPAAGLSQRPTGRYPRPGYECGVEISITLDVGGGAYGCHEDNPDGLPNERAVFIGCHRDH
jgi:hypothetical protein